MSWSSSKLEWWAFGPTRETLLVRWPRRSHPRRMIGTWDASGEVICEGRARRRTCRCWGWSRRRWLDRRANKRIDEGRATGCNGLRRLAVAALLRWLLLLFSGTPSLHWTAELSSTGYIYFDDSNLVELTSMLKRKNSNRISLHIPWKFPIPSPTRIQEYEQ